VVTATPGFELVGTADSGEQAVTVSKALLPDLVLMDVRMPGLGGLKAARRIHEEAPSAVVTMLTADSAGPPGTEDIPILSKRRLTPRTLIEHWARVAPA